MFSSPVFMLGSVIATLWGGVFHLLLGERWTDLVLYWFVSLVGFFVGHFMATAIGLPWPKIGQIHIIEASLICWVAMLIARWVKV